MKSFLFRFVQKFFRVSVLCAMSAVFLAGQRADHARHAASAPPAEVQAGIRWAANSVHPEAAAPLLAQTLAQYPQWREGWWQLGSLAYEQNQYMEGRVAFSTLAKLDPNAGATWVMLGLCDFELRDFGLSLLHIEKGRALGFPKNPQLSDVARYHEALDLILVEEFEQAGFLLDSFAREGHRSGDVTLAEGLAAMQIPSIGPLYPRGVDSAQLNLVRRVGEARYAAVEKKVQQARSIYQQLLQEYPHAAGLHYAYGSQLARWGDNAKALEQFREEMQINPDLAAAHLEAAYLLYRAERLDSAMPEARLAVRLLPESFASHFVLGQVLVAQGKLHEGVAELEKSRDLQPDSSQVHYALAQVYIKLHRRADASKEQAAFNRLRPIEASMIHKGTLPASVFESPDLPSSGHAEAVPRP